MSEFVLKEWHVFVIFLSLFVSILKNEISDFIKSVILTYELRKLIGKKVLVLKPDGAWEELTIKFIQIPVPLIRTGGIYVEHVNTKGDYVEEKINFSIWLSQRIRVK